MENNKNYVGTALVSAGDWFVMDGGKFLVSIADYENKNPQQESALKFEFPSGLTLIQVDTGARWKLPKSIPEGLTPQDFIGTLGRPVIEWTYIPSKNVKGVDIRL